MARRDISMSAGEAAQFLAGGWNLQVATLGADGWPHLTTLWYTMLEGRIAFRSFSRSQRIVNLKRHPKITTLVEEGRGYEELRGVMVQGTAELIADRDVVLEIYAAVTSKYQFGGETVDPAAIEAMFGEYAAKNTAVIVHPERTVSWDHRKLEGAY